MQPGVVVGSRFTIERETGAGGMGTVYAAADEVTGTRVALKVLARTNAVDVERFVREAQALADTDHPAIVRYVAHGTTPAGQLYLAMEWLEGEDLAARIVRSGLTIAESVRLAHHVADALGALHRRGIIHRDIKPSNVFLVDCDVDRIKLLDLGIARKVEAAGTLTRAGALVGTPGYMAPEQARGQSNVSPRADLFALGCVLFECLTGSPAFQGENVMALLAKILLADASRVRELRPDVPERLDELCACLLRKDPEDRPANAGVVIEALASLDRSDAPAPNARATLRRTPALTSSEQRLVCLLLAGDNDSSGTDSGDSLAPTMSSDLATKELEALRTRVTSVGVRIERLVDGSLIGIAQRDADATEQAVATARAALILRAEMPGAPIAVATGRGDVSTPLPVGDVIDRAAKLFRVSRRAAAPRPVVIDELTAGLLHERFDVARRADAHVLVSEMHDTGVGARTLLGKKTPFVGRDRELAMLDGLVGECVSEGVACVVLVTAAPGVGKSRLRREVIARATQAFPKLAVWMGRGDPMQTGSPFALLARALRDAFGTVFGESHEQSAQVRAHIDALAIPDGDRVAAFACELIGARANAGVDSSDRLDVAAARTDAQLMNDQLRAAWLAWIDAETHIRPVMLVLEDLQWGDAPTVSFVDDALRLFAERPLFVLAVARPEVERVFPKLWVERNVQPLPLRELSRKAGETLARHVLGATAAPAVVEGVVSRAMGNPFFLEELLRAAAERGDVMALPETVLAVVESRLDSLDPDGRRVLRAASVFGETFHAGGIVALLGDDKIGVDVKGWLELLVRKESIVAKPTSSIPSEPEYAFRHALVRDAAYAMLTDKDRKLGHVLAGTWLESKGVADESLLAEHYERGGARSKATFFFLRAAGRRMTGNDVLGALAATARGLACADAASDVAPLYVARAEAHSALGQFEEAERAAEEALRTVSAGTPTWWAAIEEVVEAAGRLSHVETLDAMVFLIERADCEAATRERASAVGVAVGALVDVGSYETARRLLGTVKGIDTGDPIADARIAEAQGRLDLAFGDIASFCERMAFARAAYERAGAVRLTASRMISVAYGGMLLGRFEEAARTLASAADTASSLGGMMGNVLSAKHNLGLALLRLGRIDESLVVETEALELARDQKNRRMEGACLYYLSLALHARGDYEAAERRASESVFACEHVPPSRAEALAARAHARLARGDIAQALVDAREAMGILHDVGGIDEGEPFIRLIHALALQASGALGDARDAIHGARKHVQARAAKMPDAEARAMFLTVWENAETLRVAHELNVAEN